MPKNETDPALVIVATTLKKSLVEFKDQMSVYAAQSWSENGHRYSEAERFGGLRDSGPAGPPPVGMSRGSPGGRHLVSAMDQRRVNVERDMEVHARGMIHAHHFEGSRSKPIHPGMDYGPPGRPPGVLVENGYRDNHFHRSPQSYMDIDRSRTDRPTRLYGPEIRGYPEDRLYPPFNDYHQPLPPPAYPGGPRTLLPLPPDDRNQGMRRGYDSPSWSPNIDPPDSTSSPNAYPPPSSHPPPLRHHDSFPMESRKIIDRPPPFNHHSREALWRGDNQRRSYPSPRTDERYFSQVHGRGATTGPSYHHHRQANHLSIDRDPRLRRTQSSQNSPSPKPSGGATSSSSVSSSADKLKQIFAEHCYAKKYEPGVGVVETASSPSIESQCESQAGTPTSPTKLRCLSERDIDLNKKINLETSEMVIKIISDPKRGNEDATPDTTRKLSTDLVMKDLSLQATKESSKGGVPEREVNALSPQSSIADSPFSPLSPTLSLNNFKVDLDTEPESSSDEEEQQMSLEPQAAMALSSRSSVKSDNESLLADNKSVTQQPLEAESNGLINRTLRNRRVVPLPVAPVKYNMRKQPVAVVDNKVPSVNLLRDGVNSSASYSNQDSANSESQSGPSRRTRRSKRLATTLQDNLLELLKVNSDKSSTASTLSDGLESGAENKRREEIPGEKKEELTKEQKMLIRLAHARAIKAAKEKKRADIIEHKKQRTTRSTLLRKREHDDEEYPAELPPPTRRKRKTTDFVPEILTSKSRTESVTLQRRKEMEMQIQQNERERLATARPEEGERHNAPSPVIAEPTDSSLGDDISSQESTLSSRDVDTPSNKSSLLDEFPPDIAIRCKRVSSVRSCSGDTPLHKVCRTAKYDMVRYFLLVEKLSVNAADYAGWTPLHEACSHSNVKVAELLIQHGADVNLSATDGTRPIHDAIDVGSLELVKLLIQHGADPLAEQGDKTPIEIAFDRNLPEIHSYLQSVVEELKAQKSKIATSVAQEPVKTEAPSAVKEKVQDKWGDDDPMIPVDGYSSDDAKFGVELDHPLFYVTPIIEMSDTPFLPIYNLEVSSGRNPRRHNFHLLSDVLFALKMTESELRKKCRQIFAVELTISEFMIRCKNSFKHKDARPPSLRDMPSDTKVKLIPLCAQLRSLFNIEVQNMDD